MSGSFRDQLERHVPTWVEEGLIDEEQGRAILDRHPVGAESAGDEWAGDWTSTLLYGTAAVLLGAAAIALVFVGLDPDPKQPYLAVVGGVLAAAGLGVALAMPEQELLADALLAAALAPFAVAAFGPDAEAGASLLYGTIGMAVPAAYVLVRREGAFLPTLSVIGFTAAAAGTAFNVFDGDSAQTLFWVLAQLVLVLGLLGIDRLLRSEDASTPVALAVLGFGGSLVPWLAEGVDVGSSETIELLLGGAMIAVLGAGIALRHRGLVVGAAVGLCVDAIVFAFDVGGVLLGSGLLVALAVVLISQAERVRTWVLETA